MASINISNLHLAGSKLFSDSENDLSGLSLKEINGIKGGGIRVVPIAPEPEPPKPICFGRICIEP